MKMNLREAINEITTLPGGHPYVRHPNATDEGIIASSIHTHMAEIKKKQDDLAALEKIVNKTTNKATGKSIRSAQASLSQAFRWLGTSLKDLGNPN